MTVVFAPPINLIRGSAAPPDFGPPAPVAQDATRTDKDREKGIDLDAVAVEIGDHHRRIVAATAAALDLARAAGERLLTVRGRFKRNEWGDWLEKIGLSARTAQIYMQIAREWDKVAAARSDLWTLTDALRLIRGREPKSQPEQPQPTPPAPDSPTPPTAPPPEGKAETPPTAETKAETPQPRTPDVIFHEATAAALELAAHPPKGKASRSALKSALSDLASAVAAALAKL